MEKFSDFAHEKNFDDTFFRNHLRCDACDGGQWTSLGHYRYEENQSFWNKRYESDLVCGYRSPRYDYAYRKFISKIFYFIYNILFKVPLRDPSFAFVFMNKKTYTNLNNFTPYLPDGFFWEFNARANKLNFLFSEIKINHRKRSSGDTKIYTFGKLPKVAYHNLTGLIKLKKEIG